MIILRDPSLVRKMSTACGANSGTCFVAALALDSPRSFLKNTIVYIPRDPSQNGYRLRCLIQEPTPVAVLILNLAQSFLKEKSRSSFGSGADKQNFWGREAVLWRLLNSDNRRAPTRSVSQFVRTSCPGPEREKKTALPGGGGVRRPTKVRSI